MVDEAVKALGEQWAFEHQKKWNELTSEKVGQLEQVFQEHLQWLQNHATVKDLLATKRHANLRESSTTNKHATRTYALQDATVTSEVPETTDSNNQSAKRRHSGIVSEHLKQTSPKKAKTSISNTKIDQQKNHPSQTRKSTEGADAQGAQSKPSANNTNNVIPKPVLNIPIVLASRSTEAPRLTKLGRSVSSSSLSGIRGASKGRESDPPKSIHKMVLNVNNNDPVIRRRPMVIDAEKQQGEEDDFDADNAAQGRERISSDMSISHTTTTDGSISAKNTLGTAASANVEAAKILAGRNERSEKDMDVELQDGTALTDVDNAPDDFYDDYSLPPSPYTDIDAVGRRRDDQSSQQTRKSAGPLQSDDVVASDSELEEDEVVLVSSSRLSSRSPQSTRQLKIVSPEQSTARKPESFLSRLLNLGKASPTGRPSNLSKGQSLLNDKEPYEGSQPELRSDTVSDVHMIKDMQTTSHAMVGAVIPTIVSTRKEFDLPVSPRRSLRTTAGRSGSLALVSPASPGKNKMFMYPKTPDSAQFASSETEEDISLIPEWAKGSELARLLEVQSNVNPYEIFGRTRPLLVGDIFPKKNKKPAFRN